MMEIIKTTFSTILKSIIVLLIIGFIMVKTFYFGKNIYIKNSTISLGNSNIPFSGYRLLDNTYATIGIIINIMINCFGFLSYNLIISKFKNYNITAGKMIFILFSCIINFVNWIFLFFLQSYKFDSTTLEGNILSFFDNIFMNYSFFIFPIAFTVIYLDFQRFSNKLKNSN